MTKSPPADDTRPRVLLHMPSGGNARIEAAQSHYCLASRGGTVVIPYLTISPDACHTHNIGWAEALTYHRHGGIVQYWLLHHADVEVNTHGYADVMAEEMKRTGAAVLGVVLSIKDDKGLSSVAVETENPFAPRKLTMRECWDLPATFGRADVPDRAGDIPDGPLLSNTGLMMVDLSRPEWHEQAENGELVFKFQLYNHILLGADGHYKATFRPEDWNFSRLCHSRNLPVFCTTKIDCIHHGGFGWSNQKPEAG